MCNFSLATSESYKDKAGERQEKTEWHNIQAWGKLAGICGEYLEKGKQIYLEGRIQTRKWQDRDGNDRYTTEIVASNMVMLGSKGDGQRNAGGGGGHSGVGQHEEPPFNPDDDIPF